MLKRLFIIATAFLLVSASLGLALSKEGNEAKLALTKAELAALEMESSGIGTTRVSDILTTAKQLFEAQMSLEEKGRQANYKEVFIKTNEIRFIKSLAFNVSDEIKAFNLTLQESISQDVNITAVELAFSSVQEAFKAERFEEADKLIDEANAKLSDARVSSSLLNAAYEASTRTIRGFIEKNWVAILAFLGTVTVLAVVFYRQIRKFLIEREINRLNLEKKMIERLIKRAQHEYFETKTLPEGTYYIKMKKFGELIRDINRRIPILLEELAKLGRGSATKVVKMLERSPAKPAVKNPRRRRRRR